MAAACSCSVPISRSTGIVSRTTKGRDTNIVARIMPGTEKMIWIPCSASHSPTQPSHAAVDQHEGQADHHGRDGKGQVDHRVQEGAAAEALAHDRQRAQDPKIVFSGTATATITQVR